jgi:hypothetical protein
MHAVAVCSTAHLRHAARAARALRKTPLIAAIRSLPLASERAGSLMARAMRLGGVLAATSLGIIALGDGLFTGDDGHVIGELGALDDATREAHELRDTLLHYRASVTTSPAPYTALRAPRRLHAPRATMLSRLHEEGRARYIALYAAIDFIEGL